MLVFEGPVAPTKKRLQLDQTQPEKTGKSVAVATGRDTVAVAVGAQSLTSKTLCNRLQLVATTLGVPHVKYIFTD